jgi:hypothetical protein
VRTLDTLHMRQLESARVDGKWHHWHSNHYKSGTTPTQALPEISRPKVHLSIPVVTWTIGAE